MKKIGLLAILILALTACQEKSFGPPANKPPVDTETQDRPAAPAPALESEPEDLIAGLSPDGTALRLRASADKILNERALGDRAYLASTEFFHDLLLFDQAFLQLADQDPGHAVLKDVMSDYDRLVLAPCRQSTSVCPELKAMSRDARYAFVILRLTKLRTEPSARALSNLGFALDFGLYPNSPEFSEFALNTVVNRVNEISILPPERSAAELRRLSRILNQLVLTAGGLNDVVPRFFEQIDIWGEDRAGAPGKRLLRDSLWSVLMSSGQVVRDGRPVPGFQRYVDRMLAQTDGEVMVLFRQRPSWARTQRLMSVPSLGSDTATFVLDQAYRGQLSEIDALELFRQLRTPTPAVVEAAEKYVQLRFAAQILRTQDELAKALSNPDGYQNMMRLRQQLSKSQPLEVEWAQFVRQASVVRAIVEGVGAADSRFKPEDRRRVNAIFGKFDRNIKWLVSYPNMLPVMYFISKASLADRFQFLWWSFTLDSDFIYDKLFNGELGTWFNFGNAESDLATMSPAELMLAFRNAVLSGTFEAYGLKPSDFLNESVRRILATTVAMSDRAAEAMVNKVLHEYEDADKKSYFQRAIAFCRGDQSVREEVELKDLLITLAPYSAELGGVATASASSEANPYNLSSPNRFYDYSPLQGSLDIMRTTESFYIDELDKMTDFYEATLRAEGGSDPALTEIRAKIEEARRKVRYYQSLVFYAVRRHEECYYSQMELFKQRMIKVFDYEAAYLGQAYRDLRTIEADPSQLDAINARYKKAIPALDVETQDRFARAGDQVTFFYNRGDFVLRLMDYMSKGVPGQEERYPAIAPKMRIQVPSNLATAGNRLQDYKYFYRNRDFYSVPGRPGMSEEDFIAAAMTRAHYGQASSYNEYGDVRLYAPLFQDWIGRMGRSMTVPQIRIVTLASLSKLGPVDVYDFEQPGCDVHSPIEELERKCRHQTELTAQEVLRDQKRMADFYDISPDLARVLRRLGSYGIVGKRALRDAFFSGATGLEVGLLDVYRWVINQDSIGADLVFPGESGNQTVFQPPPGALSRAKEYFTAVAVNGPPLLQPRTAEPGGDLHQMFQGYVDREFAPLLKLDALIKAENAAGRGQYVLNLNLLRPVYALPMATTYSEDVRFIVRDFNEATDFIFSHP